MGALEAFQDLFVRGYRMVEIRPNRAVFAGFGMAFFAAEVWRFGFE